MAGEHGGRKMMVRRDKGGWNREEDGERPGEEERREK